MEVTDNKVQNKNKVLRKGDNVKALSIFSSSVSGLIFYLLAINYFQSAIGKYK